MPTIPNSFSEDIIPLQLGGDNQLVADAAERLSSQGYTVCVGLTREWTEKILPLTHEQSILEYCPRDAAERFASVAATENWLSKQRAVFLLVHEAAGVKTLAGYGWAGYGVTEHVPGGEATFALRVSEKHQGKGLATPYSVLMLAGAVKLYGLQNIWLEAWMSNAGAVHIYHKLGFVDVAQEQTERPTASGGKETDTRLYMTVANELLPGADS